VTPVVEVLELDSKTARIFRTVILSIDRQQAADLLDEFLLVQDVSCPPQVDWSGRRVVVDGLFCNDYVGYRSAGVRKYRVKGNHLRRT
jgi:hypothetical protein